MRGLMVALVVLALAPAVHAETVTLRNPNGNRTGTISQEGSRYVFRDANGNAKSYWDREGSRMVHRNMNGNIIDYSTPN